MNIKNISKPPPGTPSVLYFLGNFTPKASNYCLKNRALGFPGTYLCSITLGHSVVTSHLARPDRRPGWKNLTEANFCQWGNRNQRYYPPKWWNLSGEIHIKSNKITHRPLKQFQVFYVVTPFDSVAFVPFDLI